MKISYVIPARNEELLLSGCINSIISSSEEIGVTAQIIVVADCCTDRTVDIAKSFGCNILDVSFGSRSKARNHGFKHATSSSVLFVDADTTITSDVIKQTIKGLRKHSVIWYAQNSLENNFVASIYFFSVNLVSRLKPTFSPVIGVNASYFSQCNGFRADLRSHEDRIFLTQAWEKKVAIYCDAIVTTSSRRLIYFGFRRAVLDFYLAFKNPCTHEWRAIHD